MLSTEFPGGRDITACLPDDTRVLERDFITRVAPLLHKNNDIDKSFYDKYDVKMGLRNKNGTGVRVGLTISPMSEATISTKTEKKSRYPANYSTGESMWKTW